MTENTFHHDYVPAISRIQIEGNTYGKFANRVANQMLQAIGRDLNISTHNGTATLGGDRRKLFTGEISQIVVDSMGDLDPNSQDAHRIMSDAPQYLHTLIGSSHIKGVNESYMADTVRWALEAARNPKLIEETTIRVGFGGSQDENLSARYPAYLLPPVELYRKIAAVRKKIQGDSATFPKIELFYVPHAAIEINGMDEQRVLRHTERSMRLAQAFLTHFFPDVAQSVQMRTDKSWQNHGAYTKFTIDYLVNLIDTYDGKDLADLTKILQKLGWNHGSESGHMLAGKYAGLHPVWFQDRLDAPHISTIIAPDQQSSVNITIGGRPERLFNRIRELLSTHAGYQSMYDFAKSQLEKGAISPSVFQKLYQWYAERSKLGPQKIKPYITLPTITSVGTFPVYYATEYDIPLTERGLQALNSGQVQTSKNDQISPEKKHQRDSVQEDLDLLTQTIPQADLIAFYQSIVPELV